MKKVLMIFSIVMVTVLSSCFSKSEDVGVFKVVSKYPSKGPRVIQNPNDSDALGVVHLASVGGDTIFMSVPINAGYLNLKIGKDVMLAKHPQNGMYIKYNTNIFQIGYCKVVSKSPVHASRYMNVLTCGGDTIKVSIISDINFFNTPVGDSVYVKLGHSTKKFYVE